MFARMAELLLNGAAVQRVIYLGADDALDVAVRGWAQALVGAELAPGGIWERALEAARSGSAESLDAWVRGERAMLRLRAIEGLPPADRRAVEMFGDRLALLVHDRTLLDEDDIFSASLLIYGKSDAPLAKRIGSRWFLTPGPMGGPGGGAVVLDDARGDLEAAFYDAQGRVAHTEILVQPAANLSVRG